MQLSVVKDMSRGVRMAEVHHSKTTLSTFILSRFLLTFGLQSFFAFQALGNKSRLPSAWVLGIEGAIRLYLIHLYCILFLKEMIMERWCFLASLKKYYIITSQDLDQARTRHHSNIDFWNIIVLMTETVPMAVPHTEIRQSIESYQDSAMDSWLNVWF